MVLKKELDQVPLPVSIARLNHREILYFIFLTLAKESPMNVLNHLRSLTQRTIDRPIVSFSLANCAVMSCAVAVSSSMLFSSPAQAARFPEVSFECQDGSMFVKRTSDNYRRQIIEFSSMGDYSFNDRCAIVRDRLGSWNMNASPAYLTTGMLNNQPIICIVSEWGMPCSKGTQLLTLRSEHRSYYMRERALSRLLVSLNTPTSGVLYDSTQPLYVDLKTLVENALK